MNRYENAGEKKSLELAGSETISQLARRHVRDINHTTTDEELRNAKIELTEFVSFNIKESTEGRTAPNTVSSETKS